MNVDLLKSALSGDVRKDVTQALEGDRMVTFKGDMLLIEKLVYRYVKVKG